ncbi:MAG: GGDEF domain-containing phosphodiesterase [Cloacibacillus sp.]
MGFFLLSMVLSYRSFLNRLLEADTEEKLTEITIQTRRSFEKEINGKFGNLRIIAKNLENGVGLNKHFDFFLPGDSKNIKIGAISLSGENITGGIDARNDLPVFLDSFRGVEKIVYLAKSDFNDGPALLLSVPLYRHGKIRGAVYEVVSGTEMGSIYYSTIFAGRGFTYCSARRFSTPLVPKEENSENANIAIELMNSPKNIKSLERLNRKMYYNKDAAEIFYHGDDSYYISSTAIDIMPGWYGMSVIPTKVVQERLNYLMKISVGYLLLLSAILLLFYQFMNYLQSQNAKKMHQLAYYDGLTGVMNFAGLALYAEPKDNSRYALALLNINGFHTLNIGMGELYCDHLLKNMAVVLSKKVDAKEGELCCRVRDDIFALYLTCSKTLNKRLARLIKECEELSEKSPITISCGVSILPPSGCVTLNTVDCCGFAMKQLEHTKWGDRMAFYNDKVHRAFLDRTRLEGELDRALSEHELKLYLQAKVDIKTGKWYGAEALVRWLHPTEGLLGPQRFVPIFEENGRIDELDIYMLNAVCAKIREWLDDGKKVLPISVNLSRTSLRTPKLVRMLEDIVNSHRVPLEYVEIELTESAFFDDKDKIISTMKLLKEHGFHLSIDDFGTGYSSLSSIMEMPVDTIKLDKSFIDMWQKKEARCLIEGIIAVSRTLGIAVLAEGIENAEQHRLLKEVGCLIGQGYYYSKPIIASAYEQLITERIEYL